MDNFHHKFNLHRVMSTKALVDEIEAVVADVERKEAHDYARVLYQYTPKDADIEAIKLIASIFDIMLHADNSAEPYSPMIVMSDGKRSIIPTDLTEEQLDLLHDMLPQIQDPEIKARLGDILWVTRRDAKAAEIAVEAYLESGKRIEDPVHWVESIRRYERAIRIARALGKNSPLLTKILKHIEARVHHYAGMDSGFFSRSALSLLNEFKHGDPSALVRFAVQQAEQAMSDKSFDRARAHYEIASKLFASAGKAEEAGDMKKAIATSFVAQAKQREEEGSHLAAHHFWEQAIQAHR